MTISDIAYSPAAMFLDGKSFSEIQAQSELYTIDKKQMATYCHAFERFFPTLIETLRSTQTPHIPKTQWLVLSKSIIYIFTAFLFDYAITHKANPRLINEDREKLHSFTHSQTQGDLLHALSFNKGLHEKLCSASRHLRRGHPLPKADTGSFFHVYNSKNITDYLIRKILKSKVAEIKVSNKPRVVVVGSSIMQFIDRSLKEKYDWIGIDAHVESFVSFPRMPDSSLRSELEQELEHLFWDINIPMYFPLIKNKRASARVLASLVSQLLPIQEVEGYDQNERKITNLLKTTDPSIVITSAGHHDALSTLFLAQAQKRNISLITLQHGSGYAEFLSMKIERSIETCMYKSTYLSWGNGMTSYHPQTKVIPMGSPYLNSLPTHNFRSKGIKQVLIPLEPIYFHQTLDGFIPSQPGFVAENYHTLIQVMEYISKTYPHITFLCKIKAGHTRQQACRQYFSSQLAEKVTFCSAGKTWDYFDDKTLVLLPNLSGAFHDALMAQVPFLLYTPKEQHFFVSTLSKFFMFLRKQYLAGSTAKELMHAFDQQYAKNVAYTRLSRGLSDFNTFASIRDSGWQQKLERIMKGLIRTDSYLN